MKKNLVAILGFAILVVFAGYVMAVPSAQAAGSASKGSDMKDMKCTVIGKVEVKTEKADGKEMKVPYLRVAEAKDEAGNAIREAKGKDLKIVGPKAADAEKLAGKEVELKGMVKGGKEIVADSVKEKASQKGSRTK